jgi:hypothetical protein
LGILNRLKNLSINDRALSLRQPAIASINVRRNIETNRTLFFIASWALMEMTFSAIKFLRPFARTQMISICQRQSENAGAPKPGDEIAGINDGALADKAKRKSSRRQ